MDQKEKLAIQKEIEQQCNKNLLWNRIYTELKDTNELMNQIKTSGGDEHLMLKACAILAVYKRLKPDVMVAVMYKPTGIYTLEQVIENLELAIEKKLVNFDSNRDEFIVRWALNDKAQSELDALQYPLPMIVMPKLLKHNQSSGYYLKEKQSVLLNNNSTKKDINLNHLNLMNQVEFSINKTVLNKVSNIWKATSEMSQKQLMRFNHYAKWAQNLMIKQGNSFYFSHRYDYRGRCYCEGYYLNYQGNDYCKSILEFANKEIVE